ncbi:aldehyde:ferredoxin oxidoreductase [Caloramator quimbayensis]|uniref:Aldehyde:ferredoxin oxidoreductase n=1 Tax=Caloramator quimbayensis TaxID=1147123 RepID=A0A1T4YDY6_9CLOT|nr:aldehyde ferredoxin oxidoreductase family protein [Caloramator quimbayensis]SKA99531.1 aldehyde:ferredoxin oxidoreductase [Caloramator quimbayensis]
MATIYGGYTGRVLKIDLSLKKVYEYPFSDKERELYIGGKIMAAKILYDNINEKTEPLSPDNYLVITTGPLTGTGAPSSSRFNISTLSPLTNLLTSSNCGGSFGIYLKKAGYDGIVITGRSENPIWIEITDKEVQFHDAKDIWGLKISETQSFFGDKCGKLVIGPAGENIVKYASIFSDERAAGRAGVGAVMGYKNIKAIVARGNNTVNVHDKEKLKNLYKDWVKKLKNHPITGKQLPRLGTAGLLSVMNARKMLATRNFKYGQYKDFEKVSGEYLAEKYLIKNKGCITCPIQCGRVVEVEGKQVKGPELETLGLLGANIENSSLEHIIRWNYVLDELGMDTVSAGVTIAFAMELNERGLWDCGLEFGKIDNIEKTFEDIAYRKGIGNLLAEGTRALSKMFGGEEYAMNSKGLELAAYEPRGAVGQGLGYAVSNRGGCHLNGGYLVVLEGLALSMDAYTKKSKAALTILFQNLMEAASACGSCLFTTYLFIPKYLLEHPNSFLTKVSLWFLKNSSPFVNIINTLPGKFFKFNVSRLPHIRALKYVTGMNMNFGILKEIGERGYNLERMVNIKRGINAKDDTLPKRLISEYQDSRDKRSIVPIEDLKKDYYKIRGWDKNGIPSQKRIKRLRAFGG